MSRNSFLDRILTALVRWPTPWQGHPSNLLHLPMEQRLAVALLGAIAAVSLSAQSPSVTNTVQVSAVVQNSPARITLNWPGFSGTSSITIYRKLKADASWGGTYATPAASATSYQDNSVTVGTYYEYKIVRSASAGTGYGYVATGIEVQPVEYRGKIILPR
jgi:hypothetical protein